uniref:Uncharacterized protein n=1 Tax=Timema poppense TaxID=170557 RepID=A0A7R9CWQ5_TIMPO|nr:unnamed protein product [Timema poppensis]
MNSPYFEPDNLALAFGVVKTLAITLYVTVSYAPFICEWLYPPPKEESSIKEQVGALLQKLWDVATAFILTPTTVALGYVMDQRVCLRGTAMKLLVRLERVKTSWGSMRPPVVIPCHNSARIGIVMLHQGFEKLRRTGDPGAGVTNGSTMGVVYGIY